MKSPIEPRILHRLKKGTLTHIQAWRLFGTYRLASYVKRLRLKGHNIDTESVTKNGSTFGRYSLNSKQK